MHLGIGGKKKKEGNKIQNKIQVTKVILKQSTYVRTRGKNSFVY